MQCNDGDSIARKQIAGDKMLWYWRMRMLVKKNEKSGKVYYGLRVLPSDVVEHDKKYIHSR